MSPLSVCPIAQSVLVTMCPHVFLCRCVPSSVQCVPVPVCPRMSPLSVTPIASSGMTIIYRMTHQSGRASKWKVISLGTHLFGENAVGSDTSVCERLGLKTDQSTKTQYDYLCGRIETGHIRKNLTQNGEPKRYS